MGGQLGVVRRQVQISPLKISRRKQLLIVCALAQFLACLLIYLFSCEIRSLAYFQNYIYACAFFGLGLGCLSVKSERNSSTATDWLVYFTLCCLLSALAHLTGFGDLGFLKERSTYFILPTFLPNQIQHELLMTSVFLSVFFLVTRGFKSLGRDLVNRIDAASGARISFDFFAGAALGWLLYFFAQLIHLPPILSVVLVLTGFLALHGINTFQIAMMAICLLASLCLDTVNESQQIADVISKLPNSVCRIWTPTYRVLSYPISEAGRVFGFVAKVNGTLFQPAVDPLLDPKVAERLAPIYGDYLSSIGDYFRIPGLVATTRKNVLVLGAGAGNDVARALADGADHVDAVEGQDWLLSLADSSAQSPFKSPKVSKITADPRMFLRFSEQKYDLILYSILESQTAFSPFGVLRPDNLIYTVESFVDASERLSEGGVLVVSYFPVRGWYGLRLAHNLKLAHLTVDADVHTGFRNYLICSRSGNKAAVAVLEQELPKGSLRDLKKLKKEINDVDSTSDDWPFAFLVTGSMPFAYLFCLTLVLLTVIFESCAVQSEVMTDDGTARNSGIVGRDRFGLLALACAFMLACNRAMSINAFNFGSLWFVSTLGGFAFFLMSAAASLPLLLKVRIPVLAIWLALFVSVAGDYLFNYAALVSVPEVWVRAAIGGLLPLIPLYLLATLLARKVADSQAIALDFAFILLGWSIGLMLDAIVMYRGISGLDVAVGIISAIAMILFLVKPRQVEQAFQGAEIVDE